MDGCDTYICTGSPKFRWLIGCKCRTLQALTRGQRHHLIWTKMIKWRQLSNVSRKSFKFIFNTQWLTIEHFQGNSIQVIQIKVNIVEDWIPATRAPTATQNAPTWSSNSTLLTSSLRELNKKRGIVPVKSMATTNSPNFNKEFYHFTIKKIYAGDYLNNFLCLESITLTDIS